jgi:hypothetical protein
VRSIYLLAAFVAALPALSNAALIETRFSGVIFGSSDSGNVFGYGGGSAADGNRITMKFRWDTADAPPDFYGRARFPVEADYFTTALPVWMTTRVELENGVEFSSVGYNGSGGVTQQVKIQDNCARCSFDVIGGNVWDSYGNFIQIANAPPDYSYVQSLTAGAVIYDYTQSLISGLEIGQLIDWSASSAPGVYFAHGQFAYRFLDTATNTFLTQAFASIHIDRLDTRTIPEPASLALLAFGCLGLALSWKRRRGNSATESL